MAHIEQHLPSTPEAKERGRLRRAASDGVQAAIWIGFLAMLAVLLALGIAWGLRHRLAPHAPQLEPELPALPGRPPEPRSP